MFDWLGPDADLLDTDRVKVATESLVWEFGSSLYDNFFDVRLFTTNRVHVVLICTQRPVLFTSI